MQIEIEREREREIEREYRVFEGWGEKEWPLFYPY